MLKVSQSAFRLFLIAVLLAVLVPFVSPAIRAQAEEKVLRYELGTEPQGIDPQASSFMASISIDYALFRGLLRFDQNLNPLPSIAKEVPTVENGGISKDGLTYTFHLNDWKWSDGNGLVTAHDFVYSWQRLVDPKNAFPYAGFLNGVVLNAVDIANGKKQPSELGIKAVDDKTFQVTLAAPKSFFLQLVCMPLTYVVRKDAVERPGLPTPGAWADPANGAVVGSGPFILVKWDHQKSLELDRNPNYSGTPAKLDKIIFDQVPDQAADFAAYKNGELDVSIFPITELSNIQKDPVLGKELLLQPQLCTVGLAMDNTRPPFNDVKVRQAFSHAIDRDLYIKVVNQGLGAKTYSWIPPGMFGYDKDAGKDVMEFDPALALKLLADAGYKDGAGFPEVNYNYVATPDGQRRAEWLQAQIAKVLNVNVKLNPMEGAALSQMASDPKVKISGIDMYGWCTDYPHPQDWFTVIYVNGENGNGNNITGYNNPDFEKASLAADAIVDTAKAEQAYKDLQRLFLKDVPLIPIYNDVTPSLVKPYVKLIPTSADAGLPGMLFWENIDIVK